MNKFMKKLMKKSEGFTLVELIVVIAILAILAGIAIPAYSGYIKSANNAAVETELEALSTAAMAAEAVAGELTKITVDANGTTVTITGVDANDFGANFKLFYNLTDAPTVSSNQTSITITPSSAWAGSDYKTTGATWTPDAGWSVTTSNTTGN